MNSLEYLRQCRAANYRIPNEIPPYNPKNPKHKYKPKWGTGRYPQPGEPLTGFSAARFGRNDWGEPFVTSDFYTDRHITHHPDMLFHGHIPTHEPPDNLFAYYADYGAKACQKMVRHSERSGKRAQRYPLYLTPAWADKGGGKMTLLPPGQPGYRTPQNVMMEQTGKPPPWVKKSYKPVMSRYPGPCEPSSRFRRPFTNNPTQRWGPHSYISPNFYLDAHDSGFHPDMRFPGAIPPQAPSMEDFNKYIDSQNLLMEMADDVERIRKTRFGRSHPIWRAAPQWSSSGRYVGPPDDPFGC